MDEVALKDAREAAQKPAGQGGPRRRDCRPLNPTSDVTLRKFLDESYETWMKATHRGRAGQVERIRWAFKDLLDLKLSEITTGRVERWRATRSQPATTR